jgi:hypothetical protein
VSVEPLKFSHEDEFVRHGDFIVLADRRIFAIMAFMNTCGFDNEYSGQQMHPVRLRVRKAIEGKATHHAEALERWKKYYQNNTMGSFCYQDFALSLNDDYPFRRIRPDSELGYPFTRERLADFPDILNEFWETLEMEQVWEQVKPDYLADIHKYDFERMAKKLSFIWEYLRLRRKDNFTFVSVPNLLDTHYHAIGAKYENYWYMVESPGAHSYDFNVHEYLHSVINSLVEANYDAYREKLDGYFEAGKDMPMAKSYGRPVTYAYECLVRALDHRINAVMTNDPATTTSREKRIAILTKEGLLLVGPFYRLLSEYEKSEKNFEQFLPEMLEKLPEYNGLEN